MCTGVASINMLQSSSWNDRESREMVVNDKEHEPRLFAVRQQKGCQACPSSMAI